MVIRDLLLCDAFFAPDNLFGFVGDCLRLLSMKSANALLCVPRGEGELAAGQQLPAILIGELPPPSGVGCFHAKVKNRRELKRAHF